VGHLWYNSGTNFAGSVSASTLRDYSSARMIRTFKLPTLGLTPKALFRGALYTCWLPVWVELLGFVIGLQTRPTKREACVQHEQESSKIRFLIDTDGVTANRQASARSLIQLRHVLFYDSKYSQLCHTYIPITRRWQEITWLLLHLSRAKHYTSLSYLGFRVSISGQGLDNKCSKCFHPTPKLNATIYNHNTLIVFQKLGDL
jgi:hypothetical protein